MTTDFSEGHQTVDTPEVYQELIDNRPPPPPGPNYVVTWALALFLGWCGADRFYLKRPVSGVLKLLTLGGLGVWYFLDFLAVLGERRWHRDGRRVEGSHLLVGVMWLVSAPAVIMLVALYDIVTSAIYPEISLTANRVDS